MSCTVDELSSSFPVDLTVSTGVSIAPRSDKPAKGVHARTQDRQQGPWHNVLRLPRRRRRRPSLPATESSPAAARGGGRRSCRVTDTDLLAVTRRDEETGAPAPAGPRPRRRRSSAIVRRVSSALRIVGSAVRAIVRRNRAPSTNNSDDGDANRLHEVWNRTEIDGHEYTGGMVVVGGGTRAPPNTPVTPRRGEPPMLPSTRCNCRSCAAIVEMLRLRELQELQRDDE
ncbi:hypothetical protein PTSG_07161 [Salpingoeca rosetta]|uniref:Uncharacterized protein n=1 Tax=Salpingoeca rosetta (strain ATCC 50818 / BSB-021) TaxID=946362 RepID=F2UE87_SALR5|nr:uncharacterized protein PTSG_07161 [Salpingoeca rosetta]EGD74937.1 hypothetical protein PTSG_07161 [Salpingoeca rosetta]|eukprot:XP_004992582.1 hypothetical protein PTSG_07161 [Salpingoeca rosetta]